MSKWCASCIVRCVEKEPEFWKKLHARGIDGISCQHFQFIMTILLQKQWEWHEDRRPMMRHGSLKRLTVYLASVDIKTAFDVASSEKLEGSTVLLGRQQK